MTDAEDERAVERIIEMIAWDRPHPTAGHPLEVVRVGFGGVVYWRTRRVVNGRYLWYIGTERTRL